MSVLNLFFRSPRTNFNSELFFSAAKGYVAFVLDELKKKIAIDFQNMEEERKEVRVSMARLEVGLTKGLASLGLPGGFDGGI